MADWDNRPHKTAGHAHFCDCGDCRQDGNEHQNHRLRQPHPCVKLDGQWWPEGFDPCAPIEGKPWWVDPPAQQQIPVHLVASALGVCEDPED